MVEVAEEPREVKLPPEKFASDARHKLEMNRGVIRRAVTDSKEAIARTVEMSKGINPDYCWLVDEDWIEVLKMMDSVDGAPGQENRYPHFAQTHWQVYHFPSQQVGIPFPEEDGTLSEHQRQMITSVEWVERLAREVDPKEITSLPELENAGNSHKRSEFLAEHDPEWSNILHEVSELLERRGERSGMSFNLTEDNYKRLDTPRKKLAAFLLLRDRVSNLVAAAVHEMIFMSDEEDRTEITDLRQLYKSARRGDIREVAGAFLFSEMGEQTTIDWLQEIYNHPLLTSTSKIFLDGRNKVRQHFIETAEAVIQPVAEVRSKIAGALDQHADVLRELADAGVFEGSRTKDEKERVLRRVKGSAEIQGVQAEVRASGRLLETTDKMIKLPLTKPTTEEVDMLIEQLRTNEQEFSGALGEVIGDVGSWSKREQEQKGKVTREPQVSRAKQLIDSLKKRLRGEKELPGVGRDSAFQAMLNQEE